MMEAAERLYGPYRWDRYDVLVLPPSFPFGGMENPRLTFATPTVLAGDRSLVSLIAHELAHSWSGNLVTNATWSDFWLNEGFTTYIERRIDEEVYGPEFAAMEAVLGRQDLEEEIERLDDRDEILHIDLTRERSRRWRHAASVREGQPLPALPGRALRPVPLRRVPPRILRSLRLPEHHDRGLRGVPEGAPALAGRREGGGGSARDLDREARSARDGPPPAFGGPRRGGAGRGRLERESRCRPPISRSPAGRHSSASSFSGNCLRPCLSRG